MIYAYLILMLNTAPVPSKSRAIQDEPKGLRFKTFTDESEALMVLLQSTNARDTITTNKVERIFRVDTDGNTVEVAPTLHEGRLRLMPIDQEEPEDETPVTKAQPKGWLEGGSLPE